MLLKKLSKVVLKLSIYQPIEDYQPMQLWFLDEDILTFFNEARCNHDNNKWTLFFDGASSALWQPRYGIGVMLITQNNQYILMMSRLCFNCTNNIT